MYATLARPFARTTPPRIPPPPSRRTTPGADEPDDNSGNASPDWELALMEDAETENGCDFSEGPLSPTGCRW